MLLTDASRYLDPSQRQVFDTLARIAMQAREAEQRADVQGRIARILDEQTRTAPRLVPLNRYARR